MKGFAGYVFEVLIVFLGVYLAFVVTDYQDDARERTVRIKYYDSLIAEFQGLIRHLDQEETKLRRHLAVVEDIEKGNRPHIPASDLHYVYPAAVVAAAWEGRNFESLRTGDLRSIIGGTPALTSLEEFVRMLNQLSATVLLPAQIASENCCYRDDGTLRQEFDWYPRLVEEIHGLNRALRTVVADQAIPDLTSSKEALAEGGYWPL